MLDSDKPDTSFFMEINLMTHQEFKSHFRMSREAVHDLSATLKIPLPPNHQIDAIQKVYIGLWYMANCCPYRIVARQFNISISTCHEIVTEFLKYVINTLRKELVFPTMADASVEIPGCVGYIDGTHVNIKKPEREPDIYYNRKHRHSINVLAVCDNDMKFRYYYIGAYGSAHDSRVFRCSGLPELLESSEDNLLLLGDSAYPLSTHLITAYPHPATPAERNFNYIHKRLRVKIENAFALWKTKWRRVKEVLDTNSIDRAILIIETSMLLHNFIVTREPTELDLEPETDTSTLNLNLDACATGDTVAGKAKRDQLANMMFYS